MRLVPIRRLIACLLCDTSDDQSHTRSAAMPSHEELDARSLALHRLVVRKIRREPELFENVLATLTRWQSSVSPSARPYLTAWARAAREDVEGCLELAVEDSEHATAMRQSSPFCAVLTHKERFEFLTSWKQGNSKSVSGP